MNDHAGVAGDERGGAGPASGSRQRWRTILAVLLIVVGCVLAPLAGVAVWARNQVTNTDRYVRTVAPLASDPAIQQAVADQITTQIFTYLDVRGLTNQTVDALATRGLPPRLADQLQAGGYSRASIAWASRSRSTKGSPLTSTATRLIVPPVKLQGASPG